MSKNIVVKQTVKDKASNKDINKALNNVTKIANKSKSGTLTNNIFYKVIKNNIILF